MFADFQKWAEENGWKITKKEKGSFPQNILDRYSVIPEVWAEFIYDCKLCIDPSESVWFLTPDDYLPKSDEEWNYNDFEKISLEAAESAEETEEIKAFWDRHLPIVLSVGDEYEYYAIDTQTGNVVNGVEPMFEEAETVAETFRDFIDAIIEGDIVL